MPSPKRRAKLFRPAAEVSTDKRADLAVHRANFDARMRAMTARDMPAFIRLRVESIDHDEACQFAWRASNA